jgi:hypothetical protein
LQVYGLHAGHLPTDDDYETVVVDGEVTRLLALPIRECSTAELFGG